jgi:hypothetical protein
MIWQYTKRADKAAAKIADRHYSRQKPGTDQFTPPGRVLVLTTKKYDAVWATSWPYSEYVNRVYPDAWLNSLFRNEGDYLASDLITEAISATKWFSINKWNSSKPPESGMITLIDTKKVKPIKRRGSLHYGYVYEKAGFKHVGFTEGGLMIFQLLPEDMPEPKPINNCQLSLKLCF